jgi:hypothetical protein
MIATLVSSRTLTNILLRKALGWTFGPSAPLLVAFVLDRAGADPRLVETPDRARWAPPGRDLAFLFLGAGFGFGRFLGARRRISTSDPFTCFRFLSSTKSPSTRRITSVWRRLNQPINNPPYKSAMGIAASLFG